MQGINHPYRNRLAAVLLAAALLPLSSAVRSEPSRAELLYTTHCIACHNEKVHWRDQRLAFDWNSLTKQVDRWQNLSQLSWTQEDVEAVAGFLNQRYYGFPRPGNQAAMLKPGRQE